MPKHTIPENLRRRKPAQDDTYAANRELQAAYLWMKQMKDGLEKRRFEESPLCCADEEGRIVGWTVTAQRLLKHFLGEQPYKKVGDLLRLTDNRSFTDILHLVKPGIPYVINARLTDDPSDMSVYTVKITHLVFEKRKMFFLVFYSPMKK
jgi:hypothetical protein